MNMKEVVEDSYLNYLSDMVFRTFVTRTSHGSFSTTA